MQLEIYIHGNPRGFCYHGPVNEKDSFFKRFYNRQKSGGNELIIESAMPYCYYTFLLCKNLLDYNGRPDSYFGLTVRIDAFYVNALNMYSLLDSLCKKWIIGNILKNDGESFQYVTNELSQDTLSNIQNDIVNWIRIIISDKELFNVPTSKQDKSQVSKLNLVDCSANMVKEYVEKYGEVSISFSNLSLREIEREQQFKHEKEQLVKGTSEKARHNERKESKIVKGSVSDFNNGLLEIKTPLLKIAQYIENIESQNSITPRETDDDEEVRDWVRIIKKYIPYVLFVLLVVSLIGLYYMWNDRSSYPSDYFVNDSIEKRDNQKNDSIINVSLDSNDTTKESHMSKSDTE